MSLNRTEETATLKLGKPDLATPAKVVCATSNVGLCSHFCDPRVNFSNHCSHCHSDINEFSSSLFSGSVPDDHCSVAESMQLPESNVCAFLYLYTRVNYVECRNTSQLCITLGNLVAVLYDILCDLGT